MTPEEHEARAMFLGAKWKEWLRCYVFEKREHKTVISERWLDDETLEELTHEQKFERLNRSIGLG